MIRFFRKLFKRGDFMTRADKAYYKYRAKTIFWSAFCLIIIAWVGTNLVLCALTTNVTSNFDMIYEAMEPTVLPIGKEVNKNIANISTFKWAEDFGSSREYRDNITSVTFDKYNADGGYDVGTVDVVATCNTSDKMVKLNDDVTLYRLEKDSTSVDVYILSNKQIQANPDSSFMFYCLRSCITYTFNNFDTSLVTNMMGMFAGDQNSSIGFLWPSTASVLHETSDKNVNTMYNTYGQHICNGVRSLDLSGWNTSNLTNMYGMFFNCGYLTSVNFNGWDTRKVTDLSHLFDCVWTMEAMMLPMTELDLSSFDTSSVQNCDKIFGAQYYYYYLNTIYISDRWNIPTNSFPRTPQQKEYTGK